MSDREKFEAWAREHGVKQFDRFFSSKRYGEYVNEYTEIVWQFWQKRILPEIQSREYSHFAQNDSPQGEFSSGVRHKSADARRPTP